MLKIKNGIDLKELEKFGFKKINITKSYDDYMYKNVYCLIELSEKDNVEENGMVDSLDTEIFINKDRIIDCCKYSELLDLDYISNMLYDLIQAGLVEKVEK